MRQVDDFTYEIPSRSTGEIYTLRIDPTTKEPSCTCKGYIFTRHCRHIDELLSNFPGDVSPAYSLRLNHSRIRAAIIKATEAVDTAFQLVDATIPVFNQYIRSNYSDIDSHSNFPRPSGSPEARLAGVRSRLESASLSLRGDSTTKKLQDVRSEIAKSWSNSSVMMKTLEEAFAILGTNETTINPIQPEPHEEVFQIGHETPSVSGQSFVITGTLSAFPRKEAEARIKALGGSVTSSVTRKTTYLVAGESAGSKLDTANRLGTKVLDEEAFLALLDQHSAEPVN